jgi:adenylate kinase
VAQRVLLFGAPGSGKGTQAAMLAERLGVPAISTGDMLRAAVAGGSELGRKVEGVLGTGGLVDDATMDEVVRGRLDCPDVRDGFLLDGYPRTLPQCETLSGILRRQGKALDAAILLDVPEGELMRRLLSRQRGDDLEAIIRERLRVYREQTETPLIGYYQQRGLLRRVDGHRAVADVADAILVTLRRAA